MENSRLFTVFLTLSSPEKAALRKFVASPYYNQRHDLIRLLDYMMKNYRSKTALEKALIFDFVFPAQKNYDDFLLRQAMTFLLRLIEQFLVVEQNKEDQIQWQIDLAHAYRERNLNPLFQKAIGKAEKLQEKQSLRNADYLAKAYEIQTEYYAFTSVEKRVAPLNLQRINDLLDLRYLAEKLRRTCLALAHSNVFKSDYRVELLPELIAFIERKNLDSNPLIATYYHTYQSLTDDDPKHFQRVKQYLFEYQSIFSTNELRDLFILAINYCIKRINNNESNFVKESFDLYQLGLEYGVFLQNGLLSRFTYKNIVAAGIKLGEYSRVEQFIYEYKPLLAPRYREGNFSYNLALLYYSRRQYQKSMQLLLRVEYDDLFLNLDSKNMLMKMYFELGEYDALESLLESMRTYLVREKVIGYHKTNYQNIIRLTLKLLKLSPFDQKGKEKLKKEIIQEQPLTEQEWLLARLDEHN